MAARTYNLPQLVFIVLGNWNIVWNKEFIHSSCDAQAPFCSWMTWFHISWFDRWPFAINALQTIKTKTQTHAPAEDHTQKHVCLLKLVFDKILYHSTVCDQASSGFHYSNNTVELKAAITDFWPQAVNTTLTYYHLFTVSCYSELINSYLFTHSYL